MLHEEAGPGPGVIPGESGNTGVVKDSDQRETCRVQEPTAYNSNKPDQPGY